MNTTEVSTRKKLLPASSSIGPPTGKVIDQLAQSGCPLSTRAFIFFVGDVNLTAFNDETEASLYYSLLMGVFRLLTKQSF